MSAMPCAVLVGLVFSCGSIHVRAQGLLWDTDPVTPGAQGGAGNWTGSNFWFNGTSNQQWVDLSSATFGGTAGTVTINSAIAVNGLAFTTSGYRLSGAF